MAGFYGIIILYVCVLALVTTGVVFFIIRTVYDIHVFFVDIICLSIKLHCFQVLASFAHGCCLPCSLMSTQSNKRRQQGFQILGCSYRREMIN